MKNIINEDDLTDMFGEGGKEDIKEYYKELDRDYNQWRVFRKLLRKYGLGDDITDDIQGFVSEMIKKRLEN